MTMINYADLIGTPFLNRGRDASIGLDCYGLVKEVYKRCGVNLPDSPALVIDCKDCEHISEAIRQEADKSVWRKVLPTDVTAPCVVAMRFNVPKGLVNHVGVFIGNGKFLHTRAKVGVCVDRISSPAWSRQIEGYYQYVGGESDG